MMSKSTRTPVIEFLGQDAGVGGPFAILALPHAISSDEQIVRAMKQRLYQIDLHPQRSTPDADEVRLAIHAAASQLRDPALREQLAMRWPQGKPVSVPSAWKPAKTTTQVSEKFVKSAKLLIAASGGWNSVARKRLAHFARLNRVTALEVVRAIHPAPSSQSLQPSDPSKTITRDARSQPTDRDHLIDPPRFGIDSWALSYLVLGVLGALVITSMTVAPPQRWIPSTQSTEVSSESSQGATTSPSNGMASNSADQARSASDIHHYTAIAHELDQLVLRGQTDPNYGIERFAEIYPVFIESWMQFPAPALKRAALHIAEFVRTINESQGSTETLVSTLACKGTTQRPTTIMIQTGILDVVLSDPRLSRELLNQLATLRKQCSGYDARPNEQISPAVSLVAGLMGVDARTDDPSWWSQWIAGVKAAASDDQDQQTRLVLSAMSARLQDQTIPDSNWTQTAIELVSAVRWRPDSESRYWLLGQFNDESVSTHRLAALTEAIATHSGDQGVNATMVLSPSATPIQREQLGDAYKAAWQPKSDPSKPFSADTELTAKLRIQIESTSKNLPPDRAAIAAIELARLNALAWLSFQSDESANLNPGEQKTPPISTQSTTNTVRFAAKTQDTEWAERAMNADDAQQLGTLISQLSADDHVGINSAHALVYIIVNHADSELRAMAQDEVVRNADHPEILIAVDRAIGLDRITSRHEKLVELLIDTPLPARTDPNWFILAHQAILARLARAASHGTDPSLSLLQSELAESYWRRLNATSTREVHDEDALKSIKAHYQQLLFASQEQGGMPASLLDHIESRLAISSARAQSPMHSLLGYQRAICTILAWRCQQQIPGVLPQTRTILEELDLRLSTSSNIVDQIAQAERCVTELLLIDFQRGRR